MINRLILVYSSSNTFILDKSSSSSTFRCNCSGISSSNSSRRTICSIRDTTHVCNSDGVSGGATARSSKPAGM